MKTFSIENGLQPIYSTMPRKDHRPVIGITANYVDGDIALCNRYYQQVVNAGGVPMVIPPVADIDVIEDTLEAIDGLLLTGGGDINPLWQDDFPDKKLGRINATRDLPELLMARRAYERQVPILGICRGIQVMTVAMGGRVAQDISVQAAIKHSQDADRSEPTHPVNIYEGTVLFTIYDDDVIFVNSMHHQAVFSTPDKFRVSAMSPDGIIEAVESSDFRPFIGVQWHPEWLGAEGCKLFRWLVDEAELFHSVKDLHETMLTIDSHCDTPMFFPQQIDFLKRDPRVLVDLHKMTDGRTDAATLVAYLPQNDTAPAREYADDIFNKIEEIVANSQGRLAISRTPADLYRNKQEGRKSIFLGIENGKALEGKIENVAHFARRGITYITLCHNGDNDVCDSARGEQTWGGLSPFGREVVKEMNRQGLLVDLSHAAETSFYDALALSDVPIVCSHSNCRALCDHPRNLTDEQMRALAEKGGVMQLTLYGGFLRDDDREASIEDLLRHLAHAIDVMGIDHVGLGTDFDGDGGIIGLADASQLPNFTRHLLKAGYSQEDIAKIWGGNWLRVMAQAQNRKEKH